MRFTKAADGSVTVDRFDDEADFSIELLEGADPRYLARDGDIVTIRCANGTAEYRIGGMLQIGYGPECRMVHGVLISIVQPQADGDPREIGAPA
jgi:hypothetical protein